MKRTALLAVTLIVLVAINVVPVYLLVKQAFTPERESVQWPLSFLPATLTLAHLKEITSSANLLSGFMLSVFAAVGSTLLSLLLGVVGGWAIARARALSGVVLSVVVMARLFPTISVGIPIAVLFISLGLYNHPWAVGLILAHATVSLPFVLLISYSTFIAIPHTLEESALVDGCSLLGAFVRISMPLAKSGIAAAAILAFILSWDEFTYALLLQLTNRNLPPLIYYYSSYGNIGTASALSFIMLVPAAVITFVVQKHIKAGYVTGAVKA
jgi:trehalose transport system permease protein